MSTQHLHIMCMSFLVYLFIVLLLFIYGSIVILRVLKITCNLVDHLCGFSGMFTLINIIWMQPYNVVIIGLIHYCHSSPPTVWNISNEEQLANHSLAVR